MSECPYKNFKYKINEYIKILRKPREEYGGFPPCPFVGKEVDTNKLMIELFDPSKHTILQMVKKLEESNYDSALLVQVSQEDLSKQDTYDYESFINKLLKKNGYGNLKCICFNPNDTVNIDGFNARSQCPYFLINIADRSVLSRAHKSLLKTKYFDRMNKEYLDYLYVKEKKSTEKK